MCIIDILKEKFDNFNWKSMRRKWNQLNDFRVLKRMRLSWQMWALTARNPNLRVPVEVLKVMRWMIWTSLSRNLLEIPSPTDPTNPTFLIWWTMTQGSTLPCTNHLVDVGCMPSGGPAITFG
jgi:hypothetical protein